MAPVRGRSVPRRVRDAEWLVSAAQLGNSGCCGRRSERVRDLRGSKMARPLEVQSVCVVPAGTYWVGSDSLPNAGPRHVRRFAKDVWLDRSLVTWSAYEAFVVAGGYADASWWQVDPSHQCPAEARPASVDARCEMIREMTLSGAAGVHAEHRSVFPVLGLSWFEAMALCRFFGARLPFETEWEVAAVTNRFQQDGGTAKWTHQEWCLDAYARQYWRADADIRGRPWRPASFVTIRGHTAEEPAIGPCARRGADPCLGAAGRGFRRVWDHAPV